MRSPSVLALIYLTTLLGSSLSSVAVFISIEPVFNRIDYLGIVLSLKTLGFTMASILLPTLVRKFSIKYLLMVSQWIGLASLAITAFSFDNKSLSWLILGTLIGAVQATILGISILSGIRLTTTTDSDFKKWSGQREMIAGLSLVMAGVFAPVIIRYFGLHLVWWLDGVTYLAALLLLLLKGSSFSELNSVSTKPSSFEWRKSLFLAPAFKKFLIPVIGPLLLLGWIPLLAGSSELWKGSVFLQKFGSYLWTVEGLVIVFGGTIYSKFSNFLSGSKVLHFLLYFNAVPVILYSYFKNDVTAVLAIILVPLSFSLLFFESRDRLILSAEKESSAVAGFASAAFLTRSILATVSPMLLAFLIERQGLLILGVYIFFIQLIILRIFSYWNRPAVSA